MSEFIKITFQDLQIAKKFFENNKHYSEWLYLVCEYYQGNILESKTKIIQKYFETYKKTMDNIISAKKYGKKGWSQKVEKQSFTNTTLKGGVEETLSTNNKLLNINNKVLNNKKEIYKEKRDLIDRENDFKNEVLFFEKNFDKDIIDNFINYWTEKNKKGDEMRFEKEKFFDIKKRLNTFKLNSEKWKKEKSSAKKEKNTWEDSISKFIND